MAQHNYEPVNPDATTPEDNDRDADSWLQSRKWHHYIGVYGLVVCNIGLVFVILGLAVITFLWKGVGAQYLYDSSKSAQLWRSIIISGWAIPSVTLSALAIRVAISMQAGVFTSMIAASMIEGRSITLHAAPSVSIMRTVNTGPHYLVWVLIQELSVWKLSLFLLTFVLMVTTILSQFSSTLLVSDFGNAQIVGPMNRSAMPVARAYNNQGQLMFNGIDPWTRRLAAFPAFAEQIPSPPVKEVSGAFYTGHVFRAILPFDSVTDRSKLLNYAGVATVFDAETGCVKPTITAKVSYNKMSGHLKGNVSAVIPRELRYLVPDAWERSKNSSYGWPFYCGLAAMDQLNLSYTQSKRMLTEWTTSICHLKEPPTGGDRMWDTVAFLVLNTTRGYYEQTKKFSTNQTSNVMVENNDNGSWVNLKTADSVFSFSATVCFTNMLSSFAKVNIYSNHSRTEPELKWNSTEKNYDSVGVRQQLGVLKSDVLSHADRGILTLDPYWHKVNYTNTSEIPVEPLNRFERYSIDEGNFRANSTAALCTYCMIGTNDARISFFPHRQLTAIFQDTLVSTKNPALAVQALYHMLMQVSYYDFLPEFDISVPAMHSFTMTVSMPIGWRGYIMVVVLLVAHLICGGLSIFIFFRQTRHSLLGQTWQAVSQTTCGEPSDIALISTSSTDDEVKKRIRSMVSSQTLAKDAEVKIDVLSDDRVGFVLAEYKKSR